MEYTKDIMFTIKCSKETSFVHKKLKKVFEIFQTNYFILVLIISILVLILDYLMVLRFIEILNLL